MKDEYYADRASRIDTLAGPETREFWAMILNLSVEYKGQKNPVFGTPKDFPEFSGWCEEHHGFRIVFDQDGGISSEIKVTDEQKYMLCLLKYGG